MIENICHLGQLHHKVSLELDLVVTVLVGLQPGHPLPPVLVHGVPAWQADLAQQVLHQPESAHIKHGVGVVLILRHGDTMMLSTPQSLT